ncbi:hypothetical protein DPM19_08670 [Actinomadura craniellae]|uniref:Uncharacterized protein n=1 Tax=Actinomadura craniellae TaxID=2231787 RepID=A0A365H9X8_9ACTN|nr:hypothetical protein DPM19_08670 [Actinomadura craniellae]
MAKTAVVPAEMTTVSTISTKIFCSGPRRFAPIRAGGTRCSRWLGTARGRGAGAGRGRGTTGAAATGRGAAGAGAGRAGTTGTTGGAGCSGAGGGGTGRAGDGGEGTGTGGFGGGAAGLHWAGMCTAGGRIATEIGGTGSTGTSTQITGAVTVTHGTRETGTATSTGVPPGTAGRGTGRRTTQGASESPDGDTVTYASVAGGVPPQDSRPGTEQCAATEAPGREIVPETGVVGPAETSIARSPESETDSGAHPTCPGAAQRSDEVPPGGRSAAEPGGTGGTAPDGGTDPIGGSAQTTGVRGVQSRGFALVRGRAGVLPAGRAEPPVRREVAAGAGGGMEAGGG